MTDGFKPRGPVLRKLIAYMLYYGEFTESKIIAIQDYICCEDCKVNYNKHLQGLHKYGSDYIQFFLDIHNHLNKEHNKPQRTRIEYDAYLFGMDWIK